MKISEIDESLNDQKRNTQMAICKILERLQRLQNEFENKKGVYNIKWEQMKIDLWNVKKNIDEIMKEE